MPTSGAEANPQWVMRQLRAAIGRGGSVSIDGYTYSVERARARFGYGGETARPDVLIRTDGDGNRVALEWPRRVGQRARDVRLPRVQGSTASEALTLDTAAVNDAASRALAITATLMEGLQTEAATYREALTTYATATQRKVKALTTPSNAGEATGTVREAVDAVTTLRSEQLSALRRAVIDESAFLADGAMRAMTRDPGVVSKLAEAGYSVESRQVDYAGRDWTQRSQPVAVLVRDGNPVHPLPVRGPGDPGLRLIATAAPDLAPFIAFLNDSATVEPAIQVKTSFVVSVDETSAQHKIALVKKAMGADASVEIGDVTYETRSVQVVRDGGSTQETLLFRTEPRPEGVPECLRLNTLTEWPNADDGRPLAVVSTLSDGDRAKAIYGDFRSPGDTTTCVDVRADDRTRLLAADAAPEIARAALAREMGRYAEYRDLLMTSPVDAGRRAAQQLDDGLPTISDATPLEAVVEAVKQVRERAVDSAIAAVDAQGSASASAIFDVMSNGGPAYKRGRELGYELDSFDVSYDTSKGPRRRPVTILTHNREPLEQPPLTHPDLPGSRRQGEWPAMDHSIALTLIRDSITLANLQRERQGLPPRVAPQGLGE